MTNERTWRRLRFLIPHFEHGIRIPLTKLVIVNRDDLQELINIATLYGEVPELKRVEKLKPLPTDPSAWKGPKRKSFS